MGIEVVRIKTSVTLEKELLEWMDEKIERGIYASRSHAVRYALMELIKREREKARE